MAVEAATLAESAVVSRTRVIELSNEKWERQRPLLEAARQNDLAVWVGRAQVEKFHGDFTGDQIDQGLAGVPYERVIGTPQLLVYGGVSAIWHRLIGGTTVTAFDNTNAYIGVGDTTTTAAAAQTDLAATTNKLRKAMDSTYPLHTDATTSGGASVVFRSTFGTSDANFAWAEWGIFNASTSGRMLNRKVESLGTKTSGSWTLTLTLSLT